MIENRDSSPHRQDLEFTDRGFAKYGSGTCSYGINWRLIESSIAGDPHAWLFVEGYLIGGPEGRTKKNGALHLSVEQAKALRDHLERFVRDAEDPSHWKNDPAYVETWRTEEEEEQEDDEEGWA